MEKILGIIGSLCSIIGLPVAIWQIMELKTRADLTRTTMNNFLALEKSSILNKVNGILEEQQKKISSLIGYASKQGSSSKRMIDDSVQIINEINKCISTLPSEYNEVSANLHKVVSEIEKFIVDTSVKIHINDASDLMFTSLSMLKTYTERNTKENMEKVG